MTKGCPWVLSETDLINSEDGGGNFLLSFSGDDLRPVPNVKEATGLEVSYLAFPADFGHSVKINMTGNVILEEGLKKKQKKVRIATEDYLTLSEGEDSDVENSHGQYDLLPALKAIFYAAVPKKPFAKDYKDQGEDYQVISEEEYLAAHQKPEGGEEENAFAKAFKKIDQ